MHVAPHHLRRRRGWPLPPPSRGPHSVPRPTRLDIVEEGDPIDSPKGARLEDQRVLGVPAALDDPNPEVHQRLQKSSCPAAVGEVIQWQVAGSNPEVEPLPFGILSNANPAIKVLGAIILMDGVAIDAAEPTVGVHQPLQLRVLNPELCISAVMWQKVPTRSLCSLTPPCISRRTGGGVQVGVGNGRCRCREDVGVDDGRWCCHEDRSRNKRSTVRFSAGATGVAIRADRRTNSGRRSRRHRLRSLVDCAQRQGCGGPLGNSLVVPPAVLMPKASRTVIAGGAASAAGGGLARGVVLILPAKAPVPKRADIVGRPLCRASASGDVAAGKAAGGWLPSPLRHSRHSLKHKRPQPTGCSWVQRRPLTPMHPEQPVDRPPVRSSPIPHQPRMKHSSRFVPWQSSPVAPVVDGVAHDPVNAHR